MSDPIIRCLENIQELLYIHGGVLELHGQLFHMFEQLQLVRLKLLAPQVSTEDYLEHFGSTCHQLSVDICPLMSESSLYWAQFCFKLSHPSLVSSTPTVGLENFSGFLLCVAGWAGAGCADSGACSACTCRSSECSLVSMVVLASVSSMR